MRPHAGARILHSFRGPPDGAIPEAELTALGGAFYGTTVRGGDARRPNGTVFEVRSDGKERIVHIFGRPPDGATPEAGLTDLNGMLYGTTSGGGEQHSGTVFAVSKDGTERVVYSFRNVPDGSIPLGGLALINGALYGTTSSGGESSKDCPYGCGTVFEVHPGGKERVLYSFRGGSDGNGPEATLTVWNGLLYGTTRFGGSGNAGTVFEVTTTGKERVVYGFTGSITGRSTDGADPFAAVTVFQDALYGTTVRGGTAAKGTIFEVQENGSEQILHNLDEADGFRSFGGLTVLNGVLYGTALRGGGPDDGGTVFAIKPNGAFRKLYAFTGRSGDGKAPNARPIAFNGNLFGTTRRGGAADQGAVFELEP